MVDDLQRTSEIVVFMLYVGKWSGDGMESSVDVLVVYESAVSNAGLRFCFFALYQMNAPDLSLYSTKGVSFMLIAWSSFEAKSSSEEPS